MKINQDKAKEILEIQMQSCKDSFCCAGALVTVTVETVEYTGVFKPLDNGLDSASGVSVTRESDQTLPPSPFDDEWNPRDESGKRISIPMTEARMTKIMVFVKNWHTACNKAYVTLEMAMWAMEDVSEFDPIAEMEEALPSRNVTVV